MRYRSRTPSSSTDETMYWYQRYEHLYWHNVSETNGSVHLGELTKVSSIETMEDDVNPRGVKSNKFRPWLNPVHPCTHLKTKIDIPEGMFTLGMQYLDPGWESITRDEKYTSAADYVLHRYPGSNPFGSNLDLSPINTVDGFSSINWDSLIDSFADACKGTVPQSFFLGETTIEGVPLIWDALKIVANPSRSIKTVVNLMSRYMTKRERRLKALKRLPLRGFRPEEVRRRIARNREIAAERKRLRKPLVLGNLVDVARGVAKIDLGYKFAVKPLFQDVGSALEAHDKVSKKVAYLASKRGSYTRVKVSQKLPSEVGSYTPPARTGSVTIFDVVRARARIATISCWAKVRSDMVVQSTWRAYMEYFGLNKIVGLGWELIPFSFLVDWITNAQEWVNKLTRIQASNPYIEFGPIAYSVLEVTEYQRFFNTPTSCNNMPVVSPTTPTVCAEISVRNYTRSYSCPYTGAYSAFSSIGKSKILTLGELAIQFIKS